jgi:hypothetical protein
MVWSYLILLSFLSVYQPCVSYWHETIWFCWISLCLSATCQLLVWNYLTLLSKFPLCIFAVCMKTIWFCWLFSVYISLVSVVGLKLFDCVELSRCISAPCQLFALSYLILLQFSLCISARCQLLVWNYLTVLTFLCVYISPVSVVGLKLVEFSQYISAPCQLLV